MRKRASWPSAIAHVPRRTRLNGLHARRETPAPSHGPSRALRLSRCCSLSSSFAENTTRERTGSDNAAIRIRTEFFVRVGDAGPFDIRIRLAKPQDRGITIVPRTILAARSGNRNRERVRQDDDHCGHRHSGPCQIVSRRRDSSHLGVGARKQGKNSSISRNDREFRARDLVEASGRPSIHPAIDLNFVAARL